MASNNGVPFPATARKAAELYKGMGFTPIPVRPKSKRPIQKGWEDLPAPTDAELGQLFRGSCNIGLRTADGNLADVDLDSRAARRAAKLLLPETGWIFGRPSSQQSHRMYRTDTPLDGWEGFKDLDGTVLVELRGSRHQTIVPPSVHESGESLTWQRFTEPADVRLADLQAAVRELAAAAIIARHWPEQGGRQDAALALAGALLRAGWDASHAERLIQAVAVAASDEEAAKRVESVQASANKLAGGRPITGWTRLAELLGNDGPAVVDRARDWLKLADRAPAELALPVEPPWPEPPASEAFHSLAGRIVRAIEPASEADPAALLIQVLVAFGNSAGRSAHWIAEADRHAANEFAVIVGRTSKARKGTSWGHVERLFRAVDEAWTSDRIQTGACSGEGIVWAVRDPIIKRERMKDGGAVDYVEIEADPGIADKRLLLLESEFAAVLKQASRDGSILSPVLRQAWDGKDLRTLAKNNPARATAPHISLIGHITADELRRHLTATETANGFGNRHLFLCAERSKCLPRGGTIDPAAWTVLQAELMDALAFARTAGRIEFDETAWTVWDVAYPELSDGKHGLAGTLLARGEPHVKRLAMIYALMDKASMIGAPHLMAALALWDYCERSVRHIWGDWLGDPLADDLLRLLRATPGGLTRWELSNYLGRNQSAERIGRALALLLRSHLVKCESVSTGGRPAERWRAAKL